MEAMNFEKKSSKMSEKKVSTSFRLDSNILDKLTAESQKAEISLNSLVNQVCKNHVEWYSKAADAGVGTILKPMLKHLLSKLNEYEIRKLTKKITKEEGKDLVMLLYQDYTVETVLKLIEIWLKVNKYSYSHDCNGIEHKFYVHHDMGKKYSIYLSSLFHIILEEFESVKPEFELSDNSISFIVNNGKT